MVSSIVPGLPGAGAANSDIRFERPAQPAAQRQEVRPGDQIDLSSTLSALRDSVRGGLMQVHQTLAIGHDAQAMLVQVQALAGSGAEAQGELDDLLGGYRARVQGQIAQGARLPAGEAISVEAEPGGVAVNISGVNLRLDAERGVLDLGSAPKAGDPALAQAAQRSLETLQEAMSRLLEAARSLEAHQGFLSSAQGVGGVRHDLDADGARLLALQARQGLEAAGAAAIANVAPQTVLSLFRA